MNEFRHKHQHNGRGPKASSMRDPPRGQRHPRGRAQDKFAHRGSRILPRRGLLLFNGQ